MELEGILSEFPFLQSARAIVLKGLYNQDSFRYNLELKKTAAYTTDRSILFDFITSENFQSIQKKFLEEKDRAIEQIDVTVSETEIPSESEIVHETPTSPVDRIEQSIKLTIKEAGEQIKKEEIVTELINEAEVTNETVAVEDITDTNISEEDNNTYITEEKLEIGKPLEFNAKETHSFQEWLQLSKLTPIQREEEQPRESQIEPEEQDIEVEKTEESPVFDNAKSKKLELIDKFIEANPKITPSKTTVSIPLNVERSSGDTSYLMTETLARVYLEQKKYQKAIQAYEILILKYPEKSVFFADRILDIKILQQNNN